MSGTFCPAFKLKLGPEILFELYRKWTKNIATNATNTARTKRTSLSIPSIIEAAICEGDYFHGCLHLKRHRNINDRDIHQVDPFKPKLRKIHGSSSCRCGKHAFWCNDTLMLLHDHPLKMRLITAHLRQAQEEWCAIGAKFFLDQD